MSHQRQPDYLTFRCPLTIEAVGSSDKPTPSFRMVAYTGGTMRIAGFPYPVVVELEGLSIDRQDIPVRLDHNPRQGVGHTQRVAIQDGQVIAEGLISRETSWARDVAKSAINGFPWQASIGAAIVDAEFVPNGQRVTVNGRTFDGPLHVVRQAVLNEISFVDSGADTATSARIAANSKESDLMERDESITDTRQPDQDTPESDAPVTTEPEPQDEQADESPAQEPQPAPPASTNPATLNASAADDPVTRMRKRMAAETRRVEAIRKVCTGKYPDIEARAIEEGWDESKTELHVLRASRPQRAATEGPGHPRRRKREGRLRAC